MNTKKILKKNIYFQFHFIFQNRNAFVSSALLFVGTSLRFLHHHKWHATGRKELALMTQERNFN